MHAIVRPDAEKAEAEAPAEIAKARIALTAAARPEPRRQPDLVADPGPIDALQDEIEVEAKLQFADDDDGRLIAFDAEKIAAPDLALDAIAEIFEKPLDGYVEATFQAAFPSIFRAPCVR